jgi:hypothetical protein
VFPTIAWSTRQILGDNHIRPALLQTAGHNTRSNVTEMLLHKVIPHNLLAECTYSSRALFLEHSQPAIS